MTAVLAEIFVAWLLVMVVGAIALWLSGRRQCRAGQHSWWWVDGAWVCARCNTPDDHANQAATR